MEGYQYEGFVYKYHEFRFRANVSTGPGLMIMIGTRYWSSIYTLQFLLENIFKSLGSPMTCVNFV